MLKLWRSSLVLCLIITLSYSVVGEVAKQSIDTDSSWKCLDVETEDWPTTYYDDSWWESAVETSEAPAINTGMPIWYPGGTKPMKAYFRYDFVIDADKIISGNLYTGMARYLNGDGYIKLYINGELVGTFTNIMSAVPSGFPVLGGSSPAGLDIASSLHPGKNVIAAEVLADQYAWALSGTIRYTKSVDFGSTPTI